MNVDLMSSFNWEETVEKGRGDESEVEEEVATVERMGDKLKEVEKR